MVPDIRIIVSSLPGKIFPLRSFVKGALGIKRRNADFGKIEMVTSEKIPFFRILIRNYVPIHGSSFLSQYFIEGGMTVTDHRDIFHRSYRDRKSTRLNSSHV